VTSDVGGQVLRRVHLGIGQVTGAQDHDKKVTRGHFSRHTIDDFDRYPRIMNRELSEIDRKEIDVQQANVDFR
jgi:hypothetical protein